MQTTPETRTITVYVRRGASDSERILTFRRVPEISAKEALGAWFAIDGNSFALSVSQCVPASWNDPKRPEYGSGLPGSKVTFSIIDALADTQRALIEFLGKYGYEVDFQ